MLYNTTIIAAIRLYIRSGMAKPETGDDIKKNIELTMFNINMISVYETKKATKLLNSINHLLSNGDKDIEKASLGQRVTAFIEITTWFQFKGLLGSALTKYYKEIIGSFDMSSEKVKLFLEDTAKKIYMQHIEEEVTVFVRDVAPFIIAEIVALKKHTNSKCTRKQLDIETIDSIRKTLLTYHYYFTEPDDIMNLRCEEIRKQLLEPRAPKYALDPKVSDKIREILLHNMSETDSNLARLMIG